MTRTAEQYEAEISELQGQLTEGAGLMVEMLVAVGEASILIAAQEDVIDSITEFLANQGDPDAFMKVFGSALALAEVKTRLRTGRTGF